MVDDYFHPAIILSAGLWYFLYYPKEIYSESPEYYLQINSKQARFYTN